MSATSPVWKVVLEHRRSKKRDTKYVRAAESKGAVKTARLNSSLPRSASVIVCQHADPVLDLGMTRTGGPQ